MYKNQDALVINLSKLFLTNIYIYDIMYLARNLAYIKNEEHSIW